MAQYLMNRWLYVNDWPFVLTARPTFLLMFQKMSRQSEETSKIGNYFYLVSMMVLLCLKRVIGVHTRKWYHPFFDLYQMSFYFSFSLISVCKIILNLRWLMKLESIYGQHHRQQSMHRSTLFFLMIRSQQIFLSNH